MKIKNGKMNKVSKTLRRRLTWFVFLIMLASSILLGIFLSVLYILGISGEFSLKPFLIQMMALLTCPIIGSVLAMLLSELFIEPVHKVIKAMREIKKGNFETRIDPGKARGDVLELIESCNEMAEELGSIELFKNDFINVFSHELKTPMVSIVGFAKQLKNTELTDAQKKEYLDIIISESDRLSKMSANVLYLSKLESQQIVTDKTVFSLDEQIRRSILLLEKEWESKDIELDIDLCEVECVGNEEMLSHVWINIISNAVKFSPKGGKIGIRCKVSGENAVVCVSDNGEGMSEEVITHIFEKFYQGDQSHSVVGNGLGLSIAARIVDLCGGTITAKSEVGRGSVFVVELPLDG